MSSGEGLREEKQKLKETEQYVQMYDLYPHAYITYPEPCVIVQAYVQADVLTTYGAGGASGKNRAVQFVSMSHL